MYLQIETPIDRQIRDKAREEFIQQALAQESEVPADQRRRIILFQLNKADQEDARAKGDTAEELRLIGEAQELGGQIAFKTWEYALRKNFGDEIGTKLANHQIEVGMTFDHLSASFGPIQEDGRLVNRDNGRVVLKYGKDNNASYFELDENQVITVAILRGGAEIPEMVYNLRTH